SFSGNSNDASVNANNGTVNGALLTVDRFGNPNSAYSFNGSSNYIDVPVQQTNITNYSISCWFNYSSGYSAGRYRGIIQASGASGYSLSIQMSADPTFAAPYKLSASINGPGVFNGWITQDTLNDNTWHNVVAVITAGTSTQTNSSQISMYLDGVLIDSSSTAVDYSSSPIPFSGSGNTKIGRTEHCCLGTSNFFNGKIDDVGIWNRALTAQEVSDLYNSNICYQYVTVTDTLVINTTITSFNPITYLNKIRIWPNPTNDHITIDNGNISNLTGYKIKITNSLSQQVFQSNITQQQFYVDLSTWTGNGIYFVHIIDGQGNTIDIKKIVLQ
ncbi:MAG: T9SS type A sorting domain-containing protein, partial [Bacteroidia bacterium]|nr:T9SS type A sorting domain-containing protein [Bacteroidia bacterium]